MAENGWTFKSGEGVVKDTVNGVENLYQLYTAAKADYSGRVTVPFYGTKTKTIVSVGHQKSLGCLIRPLMASVRVLRIIIPELCRVKLQN